jgi:hypothetical protein
MTLLNLHPGTIAPLAFPLIEPCAQPEKNYVGIHFDGFKNI